MTTDIAISAKGLNLTFQTNDGPVHALKDVNLDICKGDFVSFIGPSGCGKTTFLRCMADLEHPTGGSITVNGVSAADARAARLREPRTEVGAGRVRAFAALPPPDLQGRQQLRPPVALAHGRHAQDRLWVLHVAVAHGDGGVVEERGELVELALAERVVLVVVADRAAHAHAEPGLAEGLGAVAGVEDLVLLVDEPALVGGDVAAKEARGHPLLQGRVREEVAGQLLDGELVEGHVGVEGADDPVAVRPDVPVVVEVNAVGVRVARDVEPLPGAVLTRVASSHLRVGTFQIFAARGETAALRQLESDALTISVESAGAGDDEQSGAMVGIEIVANDRPGIVEEISRLLAAAQINVISLETFCESAPMSAEPMFHAQAYLALPESIAIDDLTALLEQLSDDLMVELLD